MNTTTKILRRASALLLALVLLLPPAAAKAVTVTEDASEAAVPAETAVMPGDADGDGRVTAADARLALRCAVRLETPAPENERATDADGDGALTAADARWMLRAAVGLNPVVSPEEAAALLAAGTGDADGDGKVTAQDARMALRYAVRLETPSPVAAAALDVTEDDEITAADARWLLRKSVGLDPNVTPEQEAAQLAEEEAALAAEEEERARRKRTEEGLPAGAKIVYLTFDDGPSGNTGKVLDILDRYGVKATFFVVWNAYYADMYAEIVARGHAIGLHSYTHNYSEIYRSADAYFADLQRISDAVYERTGVRTKLMRFPGGSSNTVSRNYCRGIMTYLTREVENRGYVYFDWNAANGDAMGYSLSVSEMVNMAKSTADRVVVLQHDAAPKYSTVTALPYIIEYYLNNGYYFLPLNENSFTAHHAVAN